MSRINQTFARLKEKGQPALITFIVAGDPDLNTTESLVLKMVEAGADIVELGIPFSDPIADGPIIQAASQRALQKGVDLKDILALTERLKGIDTPLVLMTYFNPVFHFGLKEFAERCQRSGVDGVIIPDLPPEEAGPWIGEARKVNLDTIFLMTPTSPEERIRLVNRFVRGFIYYVSVTGVTGPRENIPDQLEIPIQRIKSISQKPVAVGFGISNPEQVKQISQLADGVIVGSAIVKIIEENLHRSDLVNRVGHFVSSLVSETRLQQKGV